MTDVRTYEVSLDLKLGTVERVHIERVLSEVGGNISEAARRLGVYRSTLQRKMRRWTR